ncbi:hypothetical protein NEIRO03_2031 [Nematocida sp. AWRm78]|nr:hypothetical protein NEIRO02_2007 [Nematocida sp. AWRm79]KAI5185443.1 hypothetical protein NEIRO03_2031 [Nematocida sp. AWRm78]
MTSFIDENGLEEQIQKRFGWRQQILENKYSNTQKKIENTNVIIHEIIRNQDMNIIYTALAEINEKTPIFTDLPEPLTNLAYNIFYKQIYDRFWELKCKKEDIISKIKKSLANTDAIIDIIKKIAEDEFNDKDKEQAFYRLIGNNHMLMASVYIIRKDFYNSSIDILRKDLKMPKLDQKATIPIAIIELCGLTESKDCSRLQRALEILMKHGDNLIIRDNNGVKQSNADNLGLSNDDIYSLYLLTKTHEWEHMDFTDFLYHSIYRSINIQHNDENIDEQSLEYSIISLYNILYNMSLMQSDISDTSKEENRNEIKKCINQLKNIKSMSVNDDIIRTYAYSDISIQEGFNINNFKNNVILRYLKLMKSNISEIIDTDISIEEIKISENNTSNNSNNSENSLSKISPPILSPSNNESIKHEHKQDEKSSISFYITNIISSIIVIFILIIMIILSIIGIYPDEAKRIVNNLNYA